jgi:hypothetical protein
MAMIPGLNSLFILLNHSYYARWFYMPILLMALATVRALEDAAYERHAFKRALRWCALITAVFVAASGLTPNFDEEGALKFGMAEDSFMLWGSAIFAIAGLALTALVVLKLRHHRNFIRFTGLGVAFVSVVFTIFFMANGKNTFERSQYVINTAIKGRDMIDLPDTPFARADAYDAMDNLLMFWHLPNIQAFHSIVPPSIMEFYPEVGVKRDVGSRPESDYYALRPLLSVRWLFIQSDKDEQEPMPGYVKYAEQVGFNIYENTNFIPIGFTYDQYLSREEFDGVQMSYRDNILLRGVVLEEESILRNMDILEPLDIGAFAPSEEVLAQDSADRAAYTVTDFGRDRFGFSAKADFETDRLVFFSVPWEEGWTATVNGAPVHIEKANIGFMAVRVPAGPADIRFDYMTPGLFEGMIITSIAGIALLVYILVTRPKRGRAPLTTQQVNAAIATGKSVTIPADEYRALFDAKQRAQDLQRALNEAAATRIDAALPPDEQTLRFVDPADNIDTDEGPRGE